MKTKSKIAKLTGTTQLGAVLVLCMFIVHPAWAAYDYWAAVPGISVDTNWSTQVNWTGAQQTYYAEVEFTGVGANANNNFAVNNVLDLTSSGPAQMPIWELDYIPTNGNYTTLIDPGITMTVGVGNHGYLTVGADQLNGTNPAPANAVETITITGSGGTLSIVGSSGANLWVSQGSPTPGDTHNITLNLSGLDNFDDSPGAGSGNFIHVAYGSQSQTGFTPNENGMLYLAKTNVISLGNDFQICNTPGSNSLTCGVYLGIYNYILTGSGNLIVGGPGTGPAGAVMAFNPAFVGGASVPVAYLGGNGTDGRIANFYIGYANGNSQVPGYGLCDFTGGTVTVMADTMQLGQGGNAGANSQGTLNFNNGSVNVNNATIGNQEVSSGGTGIGIINVGSNATLVVNNTLTLAAVTGTLTPGTAGTININGGALIANTIVNGGGTAAINGDATITLSGTAGTVASPISSVSLTNSTLNLTVSTAPTNINTASLTTGGANTINVPAAPVFPSSSYPIHISLIKYQGSIGGAGYNFSLGTLPLLFGGYLSNNTANASVDLILTNGPPPEVWTAAQNDNWDTTSTNWQTGGNPALYADGAAVQFLDGASNGTVNLTATFNPNGVTVSNNALAYTWSSSGAISGSTALAKQGPGSLIIDNSGNNNFTGGVTIGGGILQVGNGDTSGNLPAGAVANSGVALVFNRTDIVTNYNTISGGGALVQAGGGTLQLNGGNSFTGPVTVTNGSTLKLGNLTAVGAGTNTLTIASGSTLDANGYTETRPIIVSGTGVSGNGAIINSGGAIYDNPGTGLATNIMLAGDTTFLMNSPNRWDLGSSSGGSVLGALGAYNLTLNGNDSYFEWRNLSVQSPLANITIASGILGVVGTTTFGNPSATLVLTPSASLQLYGANVFVNKQVDFQNGANIINSSGVNVMNGAMTLETGYATFNIAGGTTLTLSNVLSGSGFFYQNTGTGTAILSGNSPSFTGGVLLYSGQLTLNGLIGSGITSQSGTTISGTGTANGLVDVYGTLLPGSAGVAGTFHAAGGLTLESGATVIMNLSTTTAIGGGTNALVAVTGDLTVNGNNININPLTGTLTNGTYTLFTYTGNLIGSWGTASTVASSRYGFAIATNTPHQVNLIVSGVPNLLEWNNGANNGQWDVQSSFNWSNLTTHAENQFFTLDGVLLDDTIIHAANSTTSITIPASVVVIPNVVTNNSSTNYTISGAGKISGAASIVKLGSSKLTISTTNDFTGNVTIGGGSVQVNGRLTPAASAVGATNGTLVISNGATLFINLSGGYPAGNYGFSGKPIVVGGAGVNGLGAIQNIGNALYDDSSTLGLAFSVTLTTNTTVGGTARLDWGYPGYGTTLSTGGNNYNLTVIEATGFQWDDLTIDTNLGNIDIYNSTSTAYTWSVYGMGGSLGNPTNVLTIHSNVTMNIQHTGSGYPAAYDSGYAKVIHVVPTATYLNTINGGAGDYRDSTSFILDGGSAFYYYNNTGGNNSGTAFSGTVLLNGLVHFHVGNSPLTFSNVISGPGGFYEDAYGGSPPLTFAATNTYTGITDLRGVSMALIGNGSISQSTPISLASTAALIVTNRTDGTLTLASGQTLEGVGIVNGKLAASAGSTILPGVTSTTTNVGILTVSSNATLSGNALFKLNNTTNDVLSVGGALTYGGTLTLTNISATPLAANKSFKLFNAVGGYSGAFGSIVTEPPLAAGLSWNTNNLTANGTISVVATPVPRITSIQVNGTMLTIKATNGSAGGQFVLLQSTNVALPLAQWTSVLTNNFDGTGSLNLSTNILNPNNPSEFYILQELQ